jgi:general secretion pathway protein L
MARILGLDIGSRSVKALLLESTFRVYSVRSFNEARIEAEGGLEAALKSLQAAKHLSADQVVVALPGSTVTTQLLTMPFADARRIQATIGFEVEGQLPYDVSEVVYDYQLLETHDGKTDVLVATSRKQELAGLLETLHKVGVDPRIVTSSALAYQSLLPDAVEGSPEGSEAIVDLGHERCSVCIARPGANLEYARTFAGGGSALTRAIAQEFKVSALDAETWKETEGDVTLGPDTTPEMERAAAVLLRALAPVLRELRSTFHAHFARFRRPITRVWLTGGTARLKGLPALLSRELGTEVLALQPMQASDAAVIPEPQQPLASQAFSLAMRGHGSAHGGSINLRQGELSFKGDLDYLRGKVSRLAAFAAILVVLSVGMMWSRLHVLEAREAALDGTLCEITKKVLGQCQRDSAVALNLLKGASSPVAAIPSASALDLFAELTSRAEKVDVKLGEVEVQLERVRVRGETGSFDGVDQLVGALNGYPCFKEIKRGKVQRAKDGTKVEFELDIKVECSATPEDA